MTFAAIIGLVMGSTAVVYQGFSSSMLVNVVCVLTFIAGVIIVQFIARTNERMVQKREV
jgi:putative membrane protein